MPAKVEKKVASRMGTNISVGWVAPSCARYAVSSEMPMADGRAHWLVPSSLVWH